MVSVEIWEEEPDDTTPPVTEKTIGDPNEDDGYIIWPITPITLHAIDDLSGVNYIHFEILWDSDGDQEVDTVMADENIPNDTVIFWVEQYGILSGLIHIKYYAVDNAGNAEYPHNQVHYVQPM